MAGAERGTPLLTSKNSKIEESLLTRPLREVVGAGFGVLAFAFTERCANAVDEDDLAQGACQQTLLNL